MSAPDEISGRDPSKSWVAGLIGWSVANQLIVLVLVAALAVSGWLAVQNTPLDAVPDLEMTGRKRKKRFEKDARIPLDDGER